MYLYKLSRNEKAGRRAAASYRQGLDDRNDLHRNVQHIFAGGRKEARSVLYRVNEADGSLYAYSDMENSEDLMARAETHGLKIDYCYDMENILRKVSEGDCIHFILLANMCVNSTGGTRVPIRGYEKKVRWMQAKAKENGFAVDTDEIELGEAEYLPMNKNNQIFIEATPVEGMLIVEDREQFVKCIRNGFGRAKAYGAGMIII